MEAIKQTGSKIASTISEMVHNVAPNTAQTMDSFMSGTLTNSNGCPVGHAKNSMTSGNMGPVVVSDLNLLDKLMHFNREKIPARNVHALGVGAYGTFTVTNDITKYTCADLFSQVGKKTEFFTRFSGIFTEQGDPDTSRDPRGFALKFYTKEGNWDLLGINTPVFAVRDAKNGPDAVHAFKRDPRTGQWNPTQTWDFVANNPEGLHQMAMIYTDRIGTPMSYRTMTAYGCHTFSFVNANKQRHWVKFHLISLQGEKGFTAQQAKIIAGEDPNFLSRDLVQSIENGNYPRWRMMIQVMPEEEGYKYPWTFDATKVWKHDVYPMIEVGIIEVNRNVINYFSETEQSAFSPLNVVPGIGLSPDKLLQGRLLIYDDTQYHRIGPNFKQLYVNAPRGMLNNNSAKTNNYGGAMNLELTNKFPHYWPSVYGGLQPDSKYLEPPLRCDGNAGFYDYPYSNPEEDFYGQVREFWIALDVEQRVRLVDNLAISLSLVINPKVVSMMLQHFSKCDMEWGRMLESRLAERKNGKKYENELFCESMAKTLLEIKPVSNS